MNEDVVDKLGNIKNDATEDGFDPNLDGLGPGVMPNCPPPNVTYNGSLLSSGEVKLLVTDSFLNFRLLDYNLFTYTGNLMYFEPIGLELES